MSRTIREVEAMSGQNEQPIAERAYYLWQKEGSPDGRDREFWERARLQHASQDEPPVVTPLQARTPEEREVDEAAAQTFPASDPPAFAATSRVGATAGPG